MSGPLGKGSHGVFRHPLFWIAFISILAAALIWFAGPLLAFGEARPLQAAAPRLTLLLCLAVISGVLAAALGWRQGRRDEKLLASLERSEAERKAATERDRSETDRRFSILRRKTEELLARLGRDGSSTKGPVWPSRIGRRAMRLPWYLVIGPSGSGKSELLLRADLRLPFGPPAQTTETKADVDYVFSENAVFVDVSGHAIEEGGPSSAQGRLWTRLLVLMRRLRRRQPACGIVLVADIGQLLEADEEARMSLARMLRERVDEAGDCFKARPPIYLVFSKLDRLLGFSAFFETIDRIERQSLFGLPFLTDEDEREFGPAERFARQFRELSHRLASWRLPRLQEEPDERRRVLAYEFPDQFAALGTLIEPFVEILALPHRFDRPPFLRGVFFASALQDRTEIDLLGHRVGAAFAGEPGLIRRAETASPHPRPFFMHALLGAFAPSEASASGLSAKARRLSRSGQAIAGLTLLFIAGALGLYWIEQHRQAAAYASAISDDAMAVEARMSDTQFGAGLPPFLEVLPILDGLRGLEQHGTGTGSDTGTVASLHRQASQSYTTGLNQLFVPYLVSGLTHTLKRETTAPADLFQGLKLALALQGERPLSSLDLPSLGAWLSRLWLRAYSEKDQTSFVAHLTALGRHPVAASSFDPALIAASRDRIETYSLAQIALDLSASRPDVAALAPWLPSAHAGAAASLVMDRLGGAGLGRAIPGFYTRAAFRDVSLPAVREEAEGIEHDAWVLGSAVPTDVFPGAIGLYTAEYIRQWDGLLADLTIRPMETAMQGARILSAAVTAPSPVARLFSAIASETDLSPPSTEAAADAPAVAASADLGRAVTDAFAPFRQAVTAPADGPSELAGVLTAFEPLYSGLNHVAHGGNILELQPDPQAISMQIGALVQALPPKAQPFFRRMEAAAMDLLEGASGDRLREVWNTTVGPACEAATIGRFPFDARAEEDMPFEDLKALFGPEGQIAAFRESYLKPLVDMSVRPWSWRPGRAEELGLDAAALREFEQADAIMQAFFSTGDEPGVSFTVEPVALDPFSRVARLDIGGQALRYAHGPSVPVSAQWPPEPPNAPAVLTFTPEIDGGRSMLIGEGPWGLFRLMNQATLRRVVGGDSLETTFSLSDRSFSMKITPASARNPFELMLLENFRCPKL